MALTEEERKAWASLPFNEKQYRKDFGIPKVHGESGYTTLERTWARPTFEVNGLLSGFTGEGAKTVLPAVAMAKVSMRLVPNQDPDQIAKLFEDYLAKIAPKTVEMKVTRMHGGKPWMTSFDNQYVQAAGRAIEQGFGRAPVFTREGGLDPGGRDVPGGARAAERAVRRRSARRERACPERKARPAATSTAASSRRRSCTTEIGKI
ncbi:MAG: peptidase dimerization domain-containing protein [Vicinamibacterales bacterium]